MAAVLEPNKTKIARRVIEIFEFFDEGHQQATVMDIVRRYGRPQSSTSELLSSLVDMGLLYKDSRCRFYFPTPRIAILGAAAQPEIIRDGRLFSAMDRLAALTRSGVALFGMVGTSVQIFRWSAGADVASQHIGSGQSVRLSASTVGLLMLATLPHKQGEKLLWRLNAEAPADAKFNPAVLSKGVAAFRRRGYATGPSGFAPETQMTAKLLPCQEGERPLALGVIYAAEAAMDSDALVAMLGRCINDGAAASDNYLAAVPPPSMMMRSHGWPAEAAKHAP